MSPPSPAEQRLQEISHLFLSTSRAESPPPSPLQPASATSEPRRILPPRVIAVGSATDPFVTTFTAGALAVGLRARGRRVLLVDGVGQPWFLRHLLAIEGGPERPDPSPTELRRTGLTWGSGPWPDGPANGRAPPDATLWTAAEAEADVVVMLLPCHSLAEYLARFSAAWQEFLIVTEPVDGEVGRAFARIREAHERLPGARLGVMVGGAERDAAEGCFARLARAARRLLGARLRSYGWYPLTARHIREVAAGRAMGEVEEATWRGRIAAAATLVVADGRPRSCPEPNGHFFDVLGSRTGQSIMKGGV